VIDRDRVRAAHADAWEAEGAARAADGGGVARVRGARLMASGLPLPQWNNADVTSADLDRDALEAWYEERGVPWGVRVPVELTVEVGTPLFEKHCYGVESAGFRPMEPEDGVVFRRAEQEDLDRFAAAEGLAFGDDDDIVRRWITPVFGRPGFEHWMAERGGGVVAIGSAVWSDGDAGRAVMITGLDSLKPRDIDLARGRPGDRRALQDLAALEGKVALALGQVPLPRHLGDTYGHRHGDPPSVCSAWDSRRGIPPEIYPIARLRSCGGRERGRSHY